MARGHETHAPPSGEQELIVINEAAVYKLAFRSNKATAERFTDWVAGDVLPTIRKTGGYGIDRHASNRAGEASDKENHSVLRHVVGRQLSSGRVGIFTERKIAPSEISRAIQASDRPQHVLVTFVKERRHILTVGENRPIFHEDDGSGLGWRGVLFVRAPPPGEMDGGLAHSAPSPLPPSIKPNRRGRAVLPENVAPLRSPPPVT